jgi:copper chaperone
MLNFQVSGMTCGHCEQAVARAVRAVDPAAKLTVDRASGRVSIDTGVDPQAMRRAIEGEGYAVQAIGG